MQSTWTSHTLLMQIQKGKTTLENTLVASYKVPETQQSTPRYSLQSIETLGSYKTCT